MKWIAESTTVDEMRRVAEGKRRGHSNVRSRCLKVKIDSLEAINLHSLRVESSSPCSSPHLPATLILPGVEHPWPPESG
jgi:hypothetical protein